MDAIISPKKCNFSLLYLSLALLSSAICPYLCSREVNNTTAVLLWRRQRCDTKTKIKILEPLEISARCKPPTS